MHQTLYATIAIIIPLELMCTVVLDQFRYSPLIYAASNDRLSIVALLCAQGADVNSGHEVDKLER